MNERPEDPFDLFPLAPFLASLGDDFRLGLGDYRRISLALRAGGPWDLPQLRGVLLSLVVREADQEEAFLRRFDSFFAPAPAPARGVDARRLVAELRRQAKTRPAPRKAGKEVERPSRSWRLPIAAAAAAIAAGIGIWLSRASPEPALSLQPVSLVFQESGQTAEVTLASTGTAPLSIRKLRVAGPDAGDFEASTDDCDGRTLEPGVSCRVEVVFRPTSEAARMALLEVASDALEPPPGVLLAAGIEPEKPKAKSWVTVVPTLVAEPIERRGSGWQTPAIFGTLSLLAPLLYSGYLWWGRRPPRDAPPATVDPSLPRLFDPGAIGGTPAPRLDDETLDVLADSLGYYRSETPSRHLDVAASVAATGRSGGLPQLIFQRRKQIRRVVILEDADAEALDWNPIAAELAAGLDRRGVPVLHGRFRGVPDRFQAAEGEVHLEDLEDDLGNLLLIVSDGKGLRRDRHRFVLDTLGRWPMAAWLEPREPRGWDAATALPASFGVPVFPATPGGLMRALGRFLTERSPQADLPDPGARRGLPPRRATTATAVQVEALLGDALPWAQAVAMMMPPASLGLADALRRRFHPGLPAERVERLAALPGTTLGAGGFQFSAPILAVLRRGFVTRRDRRQQEEVLEFLLELIREAEPADRDSAEHRAWEWRLERVRLELDPDRALRRLSQLAAGSLGAAIRGELAKAALPGAAEIAAVEAAPVPLRARPTKRRGLQRLLLLNARSGVHRSEALPAVGCLQQAALAALGLVGLSLLLVAALVHQFSRTGRTLSFEGPDFADLALRLQRQGGEWRQAGSAPQLDPDVEYRVALLKNGMASTLAIPADSASRRLSLGSTTRLCEEDRPDIGLVIVRCPPTDGPTASWRATVDELGDAESAPDRLLSVGLVVDVRQEAATADDISPSPLLATRSIDMLFRLTAGSDGGFHFAEATAAIEEEIGAWLPEAQLVWWTISGTDVASQLEAFAPMRGLIERFDRNKLLFDAVSAGDADLQIAKLLGSIRGSLLEEEDISKVLYETLAADEGDPIVLVANAGLARTVQTPMPDDVEWDLQQLPQRRPASGPCPDEDRPCMGGKLWPVGATLRLRFIDGTSDQQSQVRRWIQQWFDFANLELELSSDDDAEIRIAFEPGEGSWSYLGTDALAVPVTSATMNFGWLDQKTVLHEFGHVLGFIEEHQNPNADIDWDEEARLADLSGPPNYWDAERIEAQFKKADPKAYPRYRLFDPDSIMMFSFTGSWTRDGRGFAGDATQLSAGDKAFAMKMYPRADSAR